MCVDTQDDDDDGNGSNDADSDGSPNMLDSINKNISDLPPAIKVRDTDGDGVPDWLDEDDDGDGVPDRYDADVDGDGKPERIFRGGVLVAKLSDSRVLPGGLSDIDFDGNPDDFDEDDDDDGILDIYDLDQNGNGILDDVELLLKKFATDVNKTQASMPRQKQFTERMMKTRDTDGDGIPGKKNTLEVYSTIFNVIFFYFCRLPR